MITVLQVRYNPSRTNDGIKSHCIALYELFKEDKDINLLQLKDFEMVKLTPIINLRFIKVSEIIKAINDSQADIIHLHGATSLVYISALIAAKRCHKKIVLSPHFHSFFALNRPLLGKLFFYVVVSPFLHCFDAIFTINNEDTNCFSKYSKKVWQIPHWLPFKVKEFSEITKNKRMILFVGRLNDSTKGIEHLNKLPVGQFEVHCVGDGELKRKDFIKHTDIPLEELQRLYAQASLLVVPSRYEAFSYVTLEAIAYNTPVVLSDRVRIADYIKDFQGCSVFKYRDYDAFYNCVKKMIGKPVDYGENMKVFSTEIIKIKYKEVYKNI
jgi:glycosyltransferase involved in cell wall biosynthesis